MNIKTGSCFYRNDLGQLWLAESYINDATGEVTTTNTLQCESASGPCSGADKLPEDCPVKNGLPCPIGVVPTSQE